MLIQMRFRDWTYPPLSSRTWRSRDVHAFASVAAWADDRSVAQRMGLLAPVS